MRGDEWLNEFFSHSEGCPRRELLPWVDPPLPDRFVGAGFVLPSLPGEPPARRGETPEQEYAGALSKESPLLADRRKSVWREGPGVGLTRHGSENTQQTAVGAGNNWTLSAP